MFFLKQTLNKLDLGTEVCVVLLVLACSKVAMRLHLYLGGEIKSETP